MIGPPLETLIRWFQASNVYVSPSSVVVVLPLLSYVAPPLLIWLSALWVRSSVDVPPLVVVELLDQLPWPSKVQSRTVEASLVAIVSRLAPLLPLEESAPRSVAPVRRLR